MKNTYIHLIYSYGVVEFFELISATNYMSNKALTKNALPLEIKCSDEKQSRFMERYFSQIQTSLKSEVL